MASFQTDLKEAHAIENQLKTLIERDNPACTVSTSQDFGSFSDYDLKVTLENGEEITIEVKQDKKAASTGNVAVELRRQLQSGTRETCLSVSKADAFAYFINDKFYLIDTDKLRKLATQKGVPVVKGGDGMRAECALIPVWKFIKNTTITYE